MTRPVSLRGIGALALVAVLLAGGYWYTTHQARNTICGFCQRPINPHARVVAEIGGRRRNVCCARCAITEAIQEKVPVRLISVTDWSTGKTLAPEQAWFVEGSRRILCDHDMPHMDSTMTPGQMTFDRCSPGAYAFASKQDADDFVRANGGVVRRLSEMLVGVQQ